MLTVGDKITHPMHGAGVIEEVVEQRVDGETRDYFVLRMTYGAMTLMVPKDNCEAIGVREIITSEAADKIIDALDTLESDENENWNKRHRENMQRLKSGDLYQVAAVVKALLRRETGKGLSTGERKLLSSAKQILVSEIALAKGLDVDVAEHIICQHIV